jgi:hypothetical protein
VAPAVVLEFGSGRRGAALVPGVGNERGNINERRWGIWGGSGAAGIRVGC